ncbi:hypothetical protein F2Q70_00011659 [Brassica cretica]|uniref:Uncharacterized protein n=1 Tax=Brassica cretica TaxID=69181 RepID=A0A8S9M5U0_BRACR|nr:hypothetical protein F2Q70_00011659 [Brassica cretica]
MDDGSLLLYVCLSQQGSVDGSSIEGVVEVVAYLAELRFSSPWLAQDLMEKRLMLQWASTSACRWQVPWVWREHDVALKSPFLAWPSVELDWSSSADGRAGRVFDPARRMAELDWFSSADDRAGRVVVPARRMAELVDSAELDGVLCPPFNKTGISYATRC